MRDDAGEPRIEVFATAGAAPAEVVITQTVYGTLTALDGATGAPLWRWATGDRWLYVTHGDEQVYISSATGDLPTWVEVDPPPGWQPQSRLSAHPAARVPRIQAQLSAVTALRASDGAIVWRITIYGNGVPQRTHLVGDTLITSILSFESHAQEIIALDAATGALRWRREVGPFIDATGATWPVSFWVVDGLVAVITDADVLTGDRRTHTLLDAATGVFIQRVEQTPPRDDSFNRAESDGIVFQREVTPRWPHTFISAVRSSDSAELWRVACDGYAGRPPAPSRLLAAGEWLYLLSHTGHTGRTTRTARIHALDAATGRVLWRWRSPIWLYWLFLLRQLIQRVGEARRSRTWREFWSDAIHLRWRRPIRPASEVSMRAAHGRIYVANYLGAFAVGARDGRQLWHALPLVAVSQITAATPRHSSPTAPATPSPAASATT